MAKPITNRTEVLLRQIHPSSYKDGRPASDRFRPLPSDAGFMSVDRSSLTTAAASHALYVSTGSKSAAVFGISVEEFNAEALRCVEDPLSASDGQPANAAHALVDYTDFHEKKWKTISKRLWNKAVTRGQLYPVDKP